MEKITNSVEITCDFSNERDITCIKLTDTVFNNLNKLILEKKNLIIKQKFAEKGYGHLLEIRENKRFKRIAVEISDGYEKWYADDGTDDGLLIVTFSELGVTYKENDDYSIIYEQFIRYF